MRTRNIFKLPIVLFALFSVGCSSKFEGKNLPSVVANSCSISSPVCGRRNDSLIVKYRLSQVKDNLYELVGYAIWSNEKYSAVYGKVENMGLRFVFLEKKKIVADKLIWLSGDEGEKLSFKKVFKLNHKLDASLIVDYRGEISE